MSSCPCRLVSRIVPNVLVTLFGTSLFFCAVFIVIPDAIKYSNHQFLFMLNLIFLVIFYVMWLWCWLYTAISDPGRLKDDLNEKGFLKRIQMGDVPNCVRHLPLCPICNLPMPYRCGHCRLCGACHLRKDHHCGVTGSCVADKNLKSFILSFFYCAAFAILLSPSGAYEFFVVQKFEIVPLFLMIYGPAFFVLMMIFGTSFLISAIKDISTADEIGVRARRIGLKKYWRSFGDSLFEKLIPIQKHTTEFAWTGVNWANEDAYPL